MNTAHPTRKQQQAERDALIAQLGWTPEPPIASERYAATTGELRQCVIRRFGRQVADNCRLFGHSGPGQRRAPEPERG